MQDFMKRAEQSVTKCQKEFSKSNEVFEKMSKYYGVKLCRSAESKIPGQFFQDWSTFARDFECIWKEEFVRYLLDSLKLHIIELLQF